MIYITGDKHRDYRPIEDFCGTIKPTKNDLMIVLGDNGVNYYGNESDERLKEKLSSLPITFFMVRGNHDKRPAALYYDRVYSPVVCGNVLIEKQYPSLLFAIDGEIYTIDGKKCLVLGGAYSVDKYFRMEMYAKGYWDYLWFHDEQLSEREKESIEKHLEINRWTVDCVFSHTCPERYIPREAFLSSIDQKSVDQSMEKWLEKIENNLDYKHWYCGHWHISKSIDKMRFMFNDIAILR